MTDLNRLATDLQSEDPARRAKAAEQAAPLGEEARSLAVPLVRLAGDEDEATREGVTAALEGLGPPSIGDADALANLLADPCAAVGYWAATLLGRLGAQATAQVPKLAAALTQGADLSVRERAAWALGEIGPAARAAHDALQQAAGQPGRLGRLASASLAKLS